MVYNSLRRRATKIAKRYGPDLIRYGQKQVMRYIKSQSNTKSETRKSSVRDYGGTTTQHDHKTIYRSKKMPYRKKKKWVKFVKRVKAVEISDRAKQTILINTVTTADAAASAQAWMETHLYPVNGNIPGTRDMDIIQEDINTYTTKIVGGTTSNVQASMETAVFTTRSSREDTRKELLMASGTLDVTYTNTGTFGIELDMYTVSYPRQSQGTNGSFLSAVADNPTYVSPIPVDNAGTIVDSAAISYLNRGVTLFDVPYGMSRTGAKIVKKEKFFIAPGNSITKNIRDPKNHNFRRTTPDTVYQYKNLTQSLVVCVKNIATTGTAQLTQKSTRSYKYTYEGQSSPYNRYVSE